MRAASRRRLAARPRARTARGGAVRRAGDGRAVGDGAAPTGSVACEYTGNPWVHEVALAQGETMVIEEIRATQQNIWVELDATADIDLLLQTAAGETILEFDGASSTHWYPNQQSFAFNGMSFTTCSEFLYRLELTSDGDGWDDGVTYEIFSLDGDAVATGTLVDGAFETQFVCLADGCYTIDVTSEDFVWDDFVHPNHGRRLSSDISLTFADADAHRFACADAHLRALANAAAGFVTVAVVLRGLPSTDDWPYADCASNRSSADYYNAAREWRLFGELVFDSVIASPATRRFGPACVQCDGGAPLGNATRVSSTASRAARGPTTPRPRSDRYRDGSAADAIVAVVCEELGGVNVSCADGRRLAEGVPTLDGLARSEISSWLDAGDSEAEVDEAVVVAATAAPARAPSSRRKSSSSTDVYQAAATSPFMLLAAAVLLLGAVLLVVVNKFKFRRGKVEAGKPAVELTSKSPRNVERRGSAAPAPKSPAPTVEAVFQADSPRVAGANPMRRPTYESKTRIRDAWEELEDPATGRAYWHNPSTGETSWTNPNAETIPSAEVLAPGRSAHATSGLPRRRQNRYRGPSRAKKVHWSTPVRMPARARARARRARGGGGAAATTTTTLLLLLLLLKVMEVIVVHLWPTAGDLDHALGDF
ncbi:hypothetical protein SO694_00057153 [Aureococcus anophagefferens]|uniref:WW domain-containing protein n=1 Tax=Aureococcus anophagefferens TaxID=44056 RepID=A0ABR1FXD4_AURAN